VLGERNGLLPTPTLNITITQGITFTVIFAIVAILLSLAVKSIDEALTRARQELVKRQRSEDELRKALERERRLNEVTRTISSRLELDAILSSVVQVTAELVNADSGAMSLVSPDGQAITHHNLFNLPEGLDLEKPVPKGHGLSWRVIESRQSVMLDNYADHGNSLPNWEATNLHSLIEVPRIAGEECLGTLSVARRDSSHPFNERELALVESVGRQTAIAIQNARLFEEQQRDLAERIRVEKEREKLIRELEERNDELTRFTYTVSHDLRSPLVTIKGFVGMLNKDLQENQPEKIQSDLQRIAKATDKMDELLADLLELSRIGRIINPSEEINLTRLIEDAIDTVHARIQSKHVTVHVLSEPATVYGDRIRVREVFENLIDNAVKYMGDQADPVIEIGSQYESDELILFVKDNGMGIEPQYHVRIFGLFEKLNPTIEGTGIGLALVKRIIEVHGGKIWVESEGLGKGSIFCFTIPFVSRTQQLLQSKPTD
jgi:signal transduction histidine kinase